MGKGAINREQCSTPDELSVQTQAALAAITMSSVNGMVGSYSTRPCAVLVVREQCYHGHPDVIRDLHHGIQTPEGIAHAREPQTESLQTFVEGSRELFAALSSGDQPPDHGEWIAQSLSLRRMLRPETPECIWMTAAPWERRCEFCFVNTDHFRHNPMIKQ
jgi:hypothetical protein